MHIISLTAKFVSYDIEGDKKVHLLDLHIKTIQFLFYNDVFNSSKNDFTVISSVKVYDKQIITCHFSYHTLYQPSFIYLYDLARTDKGIDMKNIM